MAELAKRDLPWTIVFSLVFLSLFLLPVAGQAKTVYVDPSHPLDEKSNGTKDFPWRDLNWVFKNQHVSSGDIVKLAEGYYGVLKLLSQKFSEQVTIEPENGKKVDFAQIRVWGSNNVIVRNVTVSPSFLKSYSKASIVEIARGSRNITIEKTHIYSRNSIDGWDKKKWKDNAALNGIFSSGYGHRLIDNKIRNIYFGISSVAPNSVVSGNMIENFAGDGMRGLGDDTLYEKNVIKNCFQVDDNHADGFQSWSLDSEGRPGAGVVRNVVFRRNMILNFSRLDQPYRCGMQGMGLFDGFFENWTIENNIVVADHWHGIAIYGATNTRILNNTVVDPVRGKPGPAWIRIVPHKDGRPSTKNIIANNLSGYAFERRKGVLLLKNLHIRNDEDTYEDVSTFNFRLKKGSRAINNGMMGLNVREDFFGIARPFDKPIDIGAIESLKN